MAVDESKLIFYSEITYDKILKSGSGTINLSGGSSWVTLASISDLDLTQPPKVYVLMRPSGSSLWRLPGGGTYFSGGRTPLVRSRNSQIQVQSWTPGEYDFRYWVLDSTMKAN